MIFFSLTFFVQAEVIDNINIQGLKLVSVDTVASNMSIRVGQDVSEKDIHRQISELYATGLFKQVEIAVEDNIMTVICTEQLILADIEVDDENGVLPADQVKKQLEGSSIIKGELLNEMALEHFRMSSQYSLRQYGFSNAEIETKIVPLQDSTAKVVISIREGESTKLRVIDFQGELKVPERELRRVIGSQTTGMFTFYTNADLYCEQLLEQDRERLIQYYQSKGYLAPSVQLEIKSIKPFQRMWSSNYKKAVFTIDAGPKFYVDSIKFDDSQEAWPDDLKELVLERVNGAVLDTELLRCLKHILLDYYDGEELKDFFQIDMQHEIQGYDKVQISLELNKTIKKVRYISFYGNRSTYDEPLRRALKVEEAKPFHKGLLIRSEQALNNLGYLKRTTITPIEVGENLYDLKVEVVEASTLEGNARYDFGSGGSGVVTLTASDPNAFGTGNSAALNLSAGLQSQQISASYVQPNFTLSGHHLSNMVSYTRQNKSDKESIGYHVDSFNYVTNYSIPLHTHTRLDLGGAVLLDQYYGIKKAPSIVRDFFATHPSYVEQYKLSAGLTYHNVDNTYMPTSGMILSLDSFITLPHSDAITYVQLISEGITYYPVAELFDQTLVFRSRLLAKLVLDYKENSSDIAFFARYFAGGLGTVRGYSALGPTYANTVIRESKDATYSDVEIFRNMAPKGGNKLLVTNFELQLPSPSPDYITPYLFVDMGNVFDDSENISIGKLRGSAGLSVSLKTPMVTITGSAAMPFNIKAGDNFNMFSIEMGTMF